MPILILVYRKRAQIKGVEVQRDTQLFPNSTRLKLVMLPSKRRLARESLQKLQQKYRVDIVFYGYICSQLQEALFYLGVRTKGVSGHGPSASPLNPPRKK